jgi:hypothetical protein
MVAIALAWSGCGDDEKPAITNPVPARLVLAPSTQLSLEIGKTQNFTASAFNSANTAITTPISFVSSNTAVITVAANGVACAGSWDSLTNPQLCTPGAEGVAEISATAQGVSSPPTKVFVHQHIVSLTIEPLTAGCISKGSTGIYQLVARSRAGLDISSTIGTATWQLSTATVGTASTTADGLLPNQVQITANTPGTSPMFVSVAGTTSVPFDFVTCPVQQITLLENNVPVNALAFNNTGTKTLTATVVDTSGTTITGVPLTWTTSNPASVTATNGAVNAVKAGGATVSASCTPPTCNIGFQPSLPIYPTVPVAVSVTGGTAAATTVLISTSECGIVDDCVSRVVGLATSGNTVGNTFDLSATPNSLVINPQGNKAFLGTDKSLLGTKGLIVVDLAASPTTVANNNGIAGKVLAVSPDGNRVVVANTADTVNQVFIFNAADNSHVDLPISGATAAAFSPDNLKVFIAAGNKLYIQSSQDALQNLTLSAPATGAAFLTGGMGGYLAGGDPAGLAFFPTCGTQPPTPTPVTIPGTALIKPLPDGVSLFSVNPPTVQTITTEFSGVPPAVNVPGCPAPRGGITVSGTANTAVDLGQGAFTPIQLLISPDGAAAYILTSNSSNVLVFDIRNSLTSAIQLANNAIPFQGGLTTDGKRMYVAASDGNIHVLDTPTGADITQITLPEPLCTSADGLHSYTCKPNLIAVRP